MRESFVQLIDQSRFFMPHGHCYLWIPSLLWLHVGSDLLIGSAYLAISLVLWRGVQRLRLPFSPVFVAFGLFIGLCGLTHFMAIWTTWHPDYLASGVLKAATAAASVATAVGLFVVKPQVEQVVLAARLSEERRTRLESAHAELAVMYRKVTELDELKSQFVANLSHELRTPLALILAPLARLQQDPALAAHRGALASIEGHAHALLRQVNDLLDLSKLEAGRMDLQRRPLDLVPWARRQAAMFEDLAQQRGIALTVEAPPTLLAVADADKLDRVLVNLLANALKFTPPGGRVQLTLAADEHDRARIEVRDTGPGVPPALHAAVFERFRQADGGSTRQHGGTGLGLAIVKDFVELHGGEVALQDAPGGGALFRVTLPRHGASAADPPPAAGAPAGDAGDAPLPAHVLGHRHALQSATAAPAATGIETAPEAGPELPPGRPTALVVDDNREMREVVALALAPHFQVRTAEDGAQALAHCEALPPDLVVTDLMMPVMNGEQLVAALRALPALDATPVLLLTARDDDALRARLLAEGAQDYLTKPFAPAELLARARNLASAKRTGDLLRDELDTLSTDLEAMTRELRHKHRALQTALDTTAVAREQAERASQVKTTFLGLVSHEMRTPLSTIDLNARLLRRDPAVALPATALPRLDRLQAASRQLTTLIEGLLDYTRLDSGRLQVQRQPVHLGRLAQEVVEEFRAHAAAPAPELRWEAADDDLVDSDPRLLKVVLSNLLANALKFTHDGHITVRAWRDGGDAVLAVHDTGIGIPPEDLDRIFLPFESVAPLQRKTVPGVGLGLTLVRHIVLALHGEVEVRSTPGEGSVFSVRLPQRAHADAPSELTS